MSRLSRYLSAACLSAAAAAACFAAVAAEHNPVRQTPHAAASSASARVIVKLRERTQALALSHATPTDRVRAAGVLGPRIHVTLADGRALGDRTQVLTARGMSSDALASRLAQENDVEWAVVDQRRYPTLVPNDPLFPNGLTSTTPIVGQWYLRVPNAADNPLAVSAIDAETAWDTTIGTPAVVIADVDTGVTQHPDLLGAFFPNTGLGTWPPYGYDFIAYSNDGAGGIPTANDGDGADADPSDPGDWINAGDQTHDYFDAADCPIEDSSWHGTQTAGIMSAQMNNAQGMTGIAPGAKLVPVRVLGKCGGYDSDIIAGMEWAAGVSLPSVPVNLHPAQVINMSLGSAGACPSSYVDAFNVVVQQQHVLVVVSAGNDEGLAVGAPANCPGALAVAGLRHAGDKVGFSDIGPEVAISAPGGNCVNEGLNDPCLYPILTSIDTGTTSPVSSTYSTSYFAPSIGTSFAAPMVTATAALMLSVAPNLQPADLRQLLQSSASPFPTSGGTPGTPICQAPTGATQDECYCTTTTCGAGMLNAHAAVSAALALSGEQALITSDSTVLEAGTSINLSGASSTPSPGQSITGYLWQIVGGGTTIATLSSSTGSVVMLNGVSGGSVTVQLTVTDSAGLMSSTTQNYAVTTPSAGGGGGGGGGAANPLWLLALVLSALLLGPRRARL